jgi:hypothetical protein
MNDNSTGRVKRWRDAHREEYLARQRAYARKRRGPALRVEAVAGKPLTPGPVLSGGVGRIETLPDVEPMTRQRWARMIQEQRESYVLRLKLTSDEAVNEWLEALPK